MTDAFQNRSYGLYLFQIVLVGIFKFAHSSIPKLITMLRVLSAKCQASVHLPRGRASGSQPGYVAQLGLQVLREAGVCNDRKQKATRVVPSGLLP